MVPLCDCSCFPFKSQEYFPSKDAGMAIWKYVEGGFKEGEGEE